MAQMEARVLKDKKVILARPEPPALRVLPVLPVKPGQPGPKDRPARLVLPAHREPPVHKVRRERVMRRTIPSGW